MIARRTLLASLTAFVLCAGHGVAHAWDLWGMHSFWLGGIGASKRPEDRPRGYGVQTRAGRLILGNPKDLFIGFSKNLPRDRRYFDVVIHGNPDNTGIQLPDHQWITYDGKELASLIRDTKSGWNRKQPLRLITCAGGHCEKSWAQDVADVLRVKVVAPKEKIWLGPNGKSFTVGATLVDAAPTDDDFRAFEPRSEDEIAIQSGQKISSSWPWPEKPGAKTGKPGAKTGKPGAKTSVRGK